MNGNDLAERAVQQRAELDKACSAWRKASKSPGLAAEADALRALDVATLRLYQTLKELNLFVAARDA